jgi:hypothetical protein
VTPRESLTNILEPAVGAERAGELIDERAKALLGTSGALTETDVLALLRSFAGEHGLVGAAARLALRRQQAADASPSSGEQLALTSISAMLESALGAEKAQSVVRETATSLGISGLTCTRAQAIRIFEALATMDGIIGVAARFAKARFILRAS